MKLTKIQTAALKAASESHDGMISYSTAVRVEGTGRTLSTLVDRGLLSKHRFSSGNFWGLTYAGLRALSEAEEGQGNG